MRRYFAGFLLMMLAVGVARGGELGPADIDGLIARLQAMKHDHPGVVARFREERFLKIRTQPLVLEGEIKLMAPDKFRREIFGKTPSVIASDGRTLWIFYPAFNEAEQYALDRSHEVSVLFGALNSGLNFQGLHEFYRIQGSSTDGGGYALTLEPLQPDVRNILVRLGVWLDAGLHVIKTEYETPRGDRTVTTYTDVRLDPVPAEVFEFNPPAGAKVSRPLG
ncbi:MAG TPA: outer membrane lipoprotein carrier protein LolA [Opitutaceae bacterium]|jgi:outer membrane lipoprotein-sorting protein|nr:outer membrane lipoprotein carrier protein LolA [Opitutaceae bacterium]